MLAHEKLDAYRVARELLVAAVAVTRDMPRGGSGLADQLERAAESVLLNLAEGAGRRPGKEKARMYDIGRGSAAECCACFDAVEIRGLGSRERAEAGRGLARRAVQLLAALAKSARRRGAE